MTKPDDQLLKGLRERHPDACAQLVKDHYEAVYRFLVHLTRNVHHAEDLTQETFGAAWESIANFQGRSSLGTWLHRIAYTRFIDGQRSERRAAKLHSYLTTSEVSLTDPYQTVDADDDARLLYKALDELDVADRTLLVLHYLQGLSYREIALVLDEPSGTIKWRMREALNALRPVMTGHAVVREKVSNHETG